MGFAYTIQVYFFYWAVIKMNYYEIGQRIRRIRKAHRLSQEELAEKVGISTTHMSHIETGNTKLSLPVFVDIAQALEVQTDSLLYDEPRESVNTAINSITAVLEECDARQARIICDVVRTMKQSFDTYPGA